MTVDSNFQGFILSNKSSVPSALLLSLQILTGNLCCSSQGKNFKANEHQRSSERRRIGSFHIRLSYVKKKKKKRRFISEWMGLTHLSTAACFTQSSSLPEHACFLSGKCPVLLCQLLFSWKRRAYSNVLLLQSYNFLWRFSTFSCFLAHWTLATSNRMKIFLVVEAG